ncbi:MAG: SpoIIE family protein phosphatase [Proteobacteria bacterium]|nr:SpoIIE family protein phosphatase [Pseudomonadota bacterium]
MPDSASIPFWLLTLGLSGLVLIALLARGDTVLRVALMVTAATGLPWASGMAVVLSIDEAARAAAIGKLAVGSLTLVGPALLFLLLTITAGLEQHRKLVVGSAVLGAISCIITWRTDWVVADAWRSVLWEDHVWEDQICLLKSGWLAEVHYGFLLVTLLVGLLVSRAAMRANRPGVRADWIAVVIGLVGVVAIEGALLGREIGLYPFSVVPALIAVTIAFVAVGKYNLIKSRGFDRASFYELAMLIGMVPIVLAIAIAASMAPGNGSGAGIAVILTVPLFVVVQASMTLIRDYLARQKRALSTDVDQRVAQYSDRVAQVRDEVLLAEELREAIEETTKLSHASLLVGINAGGLRHAADKDSGVLSPLTRVLYNWLAARPYPLVHSDLATHRLGQARAEVEVLFNAASADVLVPLVDREKLVGVIAARLAVGRSIEDTEIEVLGEVARSTARALTYVGLIREAEARMELAKEVEVAAAVQHARSTGEVRQRFGTCGLIAHYRPAAQFGGDWWMAHELPDGRVVVVIGDVTGRGTPAALVSSTIAGACQTAQAMLGVSCEVLSLLELLNDSVLTVGEGEYPMSCFAAVIDLDANLVSFANAGHPFPYRCRQVPGRDRAELHALISRGTRLGTRKPVLRASTISAKEGDILVFYSDALVEAQNPEGRRYGDRRLQNVLQRFVHAAGDRACEVIIEDVLAYCGNQPLGDDLTLVVVRLERQADKPGE